MKKDKEIRKRVTYSTDFYPLLLSMDKLDVADVFLSLTAKYIKEPLQEFKSERAKVIFEVLCNDYDKAYEITHTAAQERGRKGADKRWHPKDKPKAEQKQQQPELFKEEAASEGDDVPLVEAEEVEPYPFARFWNLYNFKHDKQPAEKAWSRLSNKDRAEVIESIPKYLAFLEHQRAIGFNQNQAYAATYLNKRRWEDDYSITETPQNYGNNNKQYNNRLAQQQRNNEVLCNIMAEAAAAVRPYNPIETTE